MTKEELIEKGLMPENVDDCYLYKNGFKYEIKDKWTLKDFNDNTLCKNVDYCDLYYNMFAYIINDKLVLKDLKGNILCENVDWCELYDDYFEYEIDDEFTTVKLEDFYKELRDNNND